MAAGHLAEGAHQSGQVLAGLGRADGEAVPLAPRGQQPAERAAGIGVADGRELGDAGRHHPHAVGIGPEGLDDLAGDEGRVGVDPSRRARGRGG